MTSLAHRLKPLIKPALAAHRTRSAVRYQSVAQLARADRYRTLLAEKGTLPTFAQVAARVNSQNGEDGILWYIFSLIGMINRTVVEVCAADGIQCNAANLVLHHGWKGLLFDGDKINCRTGQRYYRLCRSDGMTPPQLVHAWITRDNIDQLIAAHGISGSIDLLSLDVDGMDYWVLEAIRCIKPRVIVLEYQDILGPERSVTVPYASDFRARFVNGVPDYAGASLAAFNKLLGARDYRLVGCEPQGYNAFFIHNSEGQASLPTVPVASCFNSERTQRAMQERWANVAHMPWVEV